MISKCTPAVLAAAVFSTVFAAGAQTNPVNVKSPDGALELSIATLSGNAPSGGGGQLAYRVSLRGKPVLEWSTLGLQIQGAPPLGAAMRILSSEPSTHDETWSSPHGKANPIRDHYNAVIVRAAETAARSRRLDIEARAFDDGVAFRYLIPEQAGIRELRLSAELTQFRMSKEASTFPLILNGYRSSLRRRLSRTAAGRAAADLSCRRCRSCSRCPEWRGWESPKRTSTTGPDSMSPPAATPGRSRPGWHRA